MNNDIIVALIALIGTLGGSLGGILVSSKMTTYRIEQLENKVNEHNKVIDRVYKLEQGEAVIKEDIKVINNRIKDLEEFHKPK